MAESETDTIWVEACEGRVVPFHSTDAPIGTIGNLQLKPGDKAIQVPNTTSNRRKIRGGDLRVVSGPASEEKSLPGSATSAALAEDLLDGEKPAK